MQTAFVPFVAPLALLVCAAFGFRNPGLRPGKLPRFAEVAALIAFVVALLSLYLLVKHGAQTSPLVGIVGLGCSIRLDIVSATMLLLVSFIGWIVIRYSATYLDGEPRQGSFTGWLCMTLATVMLLVTAGNLSQLLVAWVGTSVFLQRLLLFYPDRVEAQRAAKKKFIASRLGDAALFVAVLLLVRVYGTTDIATILAELRVAGDGHLVIAAASMIALAGALKSAQFPTHGWLIEVMEAPTPVSATLHAGVINAGGFLVIRFADVMVQAPGVLSGLAVVGGFTAAFGGLVMLTQPSVKTSLAWSTVGQMGFMMLECGLGLFPLALLHIVAHSLYKAHSFLISGSAVEYVASMRRPGVAAIPDAASVGQAFGVALCIYAIIGFAFGFAHKSPQAIALGAILVFGVAYLIAQALADGAPAALTRRIAILAVLASASYFGLQATAVMLTADILPPAPVPGPLEWAVIGLAVISFGAMGVVQAMFPLWAYHPAAAGLRVHLSNGLYVNAIFDRASGGWSVAKSA